MREIGEIKQEFKNLSFEPTLSERAEIIARIAHRGHLRRNGIAFFEHLKAVASNKVISSEKEKAIAFLHDVVQKTFFTPESLRELGIPDSVIKPVQLLTNNYNNESGFFYLRYIENVSEDKEATNVKIADLEDNISDGATAFNKSFKYPISLAFLNAVKNKKTDRADIISFIKSNHCDPKLRKAAHNLDQYQWQLLYPRTLH